MDVAFTGHYVFGLLVVAVVLAALWLAAQKVRAGSFLPGTEKRLFRVMQSTLLSPDTLVHVVKIADRYYALGGGRGTLCVLCELSPETVTAPTQSQQKPN